MCEKNNLNYPFMPCHTIESRAVLWTSRAEKVVSDCVCACTCRRRLTLYVLPYSYTRNARPRPLVVFILSWPSFPSFPGIIRCLFLSMLSLRHGTLITTHMAGPYLWICDQTLYSCTHSSVPLYAHRTAPALSNTKPFCDRRTCRAI